MAGKFGHSEGDAPKSGEGATILRFTTKRSRPWRVGPIMDPLRRLETEEDRRRMQQNLAAALVVVFVIATGMWLIEHLSASARITECLEAGHQNCLHNPR